MRYFSRLTAPQQQWIQSEIDRLRGTRDRKRLDQLESIVKAAQLPRLDDWALYYFPEYCKLPPSKMHLSMVEDLHELSMPRTIGKKQSKIAPRSGAKTTWASKFYPLYCVCNDLEKYGLLIGDTAGQSEANLEAIKAELTGNALLAADYPHACGQGRQWNVESIITRNGIKLHALGAGKAFRGRTFGPHRPGLIVIDDLDNDEDVLNEDLRKKMWNWLKNVIIPMGDARTNFLFVGTALHEDDTIHRLKKTGEWEHERFQALIAEPTNHELWDEWRRHFFNFDMPTTERLAFCRQFYLDREEEMSAGAKLLWPEKEPLYDLMVYRTAYGEAAFLSEKQGFPSSDQESEWPAELFRDRIYFDRWPEGIRLRVIALDPSKGRTDTSDFSAFIMLGWGEDGNLYIEADIKRRDVTRIWEDGFRLNDSFHPDLFIVETNGFQELLCLEFDRQSAERGTLIPVHGVDHYKVSKKIRIRTIGPYLHMNRLRFKSDSPGTEELVKQLRQFPNAKHDDGPDALEMAIKGLRFLQGDGSDLNPDVGISIAQA